MNKLDINDDFLGLCPECQQKGDFVPIGKYYCICDSCKVYWIVTDGSIFHCNDLNMLDELRSRISNYKKVKPFHWGTDDGQFFRKRKQVLMVDEKPPF